jgi:hypothetical protein
VSLDGVVEAPMTWVEPYFDDEGQTYGRDSVERRDHGIRANSISPGLIETNQMREQRRTTCQ